MESKNKACWNCANFTAYYEKGMCRFYKTDRGMCSVKKETLEKHGVCENWRNTYRVRNLRKKCAVRALEEILSDIAAIRQIFEEENEENNPIR